MYVSNAEILINERISDRYWHMKVKVSDWSTSDVSPGQFFHIKSCNEYIPTLRRPLSIYRINRDENTLEFLYLVKGVGTKKLAEKKIRDDLDILGPLGNTFTLDPESKGILLVARGVGIATLSALAFAAVTHHIPCFAILSARTKEDILVEKQLQEMGVTTYSVNDLDGTSDPKKIRILVEQVIKQFQIDSIYTCGSKRLAKLLKEIAGRLHLFAEIALEEYMGCGLGACYACVCDIQEEDHISKTRVCQEGPVFPLKKVIL